MSNSRHDIVPAIRQDSMTYKYSLSLAGTGGNQDGVEGVYQLMVYTIDKFASLRTSP